ncbi:MAG: hypothetical protein OEV40_11885 [Acidimicrobiia bacterium]|nr:hypothetical protein [Acidimicrobiia bacterium]
MYVGADLPLDVLGGAAIGVLTSPTRPRLPNWSANDRPTARTVGRRRLFLRLGVTRLRAEVSAASAWEPFAVPRAISAPTTSQLACWTIAAPAPWGGKRAGFPAS